MIKNDLEILNDDKKKLYNLNTKIEDILKTLFVKNYKLVVLQTIITLFPNFQGKLLSTPVVGTYINTQSLMEY